MHGNVINLQVKYFDDLGNLRESLIPDTFIDKNRSKHLLNEGDILFAAKGNKNIAAVYHSEYGPAVAASSFFVIRLANNFKNQILPEYIAWLINHPYNQKILKGEAKGTSLRSISIGGISNLVVDIPELNKQHTILHICRLRNKEKELTALIEYNKDILLQVKLLKGNL